MALRPMLAATMTSSWRPLLPAATALAVASVTGWVARTRSSGVALRIGGSPDTLTLISCQMASTVDSRALVPLACSSSTARTVLSRDVTLVTITCAGKGNAMAGSSMFFPEAALVACTRSPRAEATSLTAFMSRTWASVLCDPREAAPITLERKIPPTSASWRMVVTAFCAATASCSWLEAAPATRVLVSSTRALAVFRMLSLQAQMAASHRWSTNLSPSPCACRVPAVANMMVVSRSPMMPLTVLAALMHAWVPREPACSAARMWDTCARVAASQQ
ncbi:unnamed protein product [Ixodes hexagonus]